MAAEPTVSTGADPLDRRRSPRPSPPSGPHLIWPESAFPFVLTERQDALGAISAMLPDNTSLVTGAIRVESKVAGQAGEFVFNSVYSIGSNGEIEAATDKVHLVPFGEYLPFEEILEGLGAIIVAFAGPIDVDEPFPFQR